MQDAGSNAQKFISHSSGSSTQTNFEFNSNFSNWSSHLRKKNEFNSATFENGKNYSIGFEISNNSPIFYSIRFEVKKNTIRTSLCKSQFVQRRGVSVKTTYRGIVVSVAQVMDAAVKIVFSVSKYWLAVSSR